MAMSAEHRSQFAALHRPWYRLHMSEKFSSGTKNHPPPQKKLHTLCVFSVHITYWIYQNGPSAKHFITIKVDGVAFE